VLDTIEGAVERLDVLRDELAIVVVLILLDGTPPPDALH
jgi:hypothetical protein